ncbi:LysR family transcriptional regulator [Loktanella sp. Alg231-35]|uniref:LysR family transcriptional regulator n=1 Tax=Loktanella sp. Alg231-35 TaxID=1922220 RepID=UPI000D54D54B|nr:LysR family transcriptional regulator [Loktanella sp. Alg231-35]
MQPDPKHILSFKTALSAGTIRAAADQLGLEPSTVSRNITALEKQLATALIERGRKGVMPTEAGELLMGYVHRQSGEMEALRSQLDALANMERGTVSVALGEGFLGDFSQSVLRPFSQDHPGVTYALDVGATDHVRDAVIEDKAHVGLAFNVAPDPRLKIIAQTEHPLVMICARGGRFDTGKTVDIQDLSRLPCGFLSKGYGVGAVIAAMEASHGFRARGVLETGSIAALKAFVKNDLGVTLLPEFVVAEDMQAGTLCTKHVSIRDFGLGTATLFVRQGRRLPLATQKLLVFMSRSLAALA